MKAMIFAAGLGTRLKPLTDSTPKALLPINGKPMLEHVILKLKDAGFHQIAINVHHLGDQIINFLAANNNFGIQIHISDERDYLLDTGGGIKHATAFLQGNEPFLIHNVDILSDIDLRALYNHHIETNPLATLLVINFYLSICAKANIHAYADEDLHLIDVGKPETLQVAEKWMKTLIV